MQVETDDSVVHTMPNQIKMSPCQWTMALTRDFELKLVTSFAYQFCSKQRSTYKYKHCTNFTSSS